jgi:hypothetical protein
VALIAFGADSLIEGLAGFGSDNGTDGSVDVLAQVDLERLRVTPEAIGPFGVAVLDWRVTGPAGFRVELNGQPVQRADTRVVAPRVSQRYSLVASSGTVRRGLGSVGLTVDLDACMRFELNNPEALLSGALANAVDQMEGMSLLQGPQVTFKPGEISFFLWLSKAIDKFPDPTVQIRGSFGLDVEDGGLVARGQKVTADVHVSRWAWLIPGAVPGLAIAINLAEDTARQGGRNAISGMVALLAFMWTPAAGMGRHDVQIDNEDGFGVIRVRECPTDEQIRFATRYATEFAPCASASAWSRARTTAVRDSTAGSRAATRTRPT